MGDYPEFTAVSSTNVLGVAWAENALYIEFQGGSRYRYDVPDAEEQHNAIISSASPGGYVNDEIKGLYPYRRA